ncbi:hypothetical protein [Kordiimonas aestuarii]|uniref:hypothetical protein n=1 Tax=Kordiimonas aestuarii TaxID=1005925 RepID=UPI0021D0590D|nr:hypothetical protein [Kordiimonas aestuarii]
MDTMTMPVNSGDIRELEMVETQEVAGGFICAGLCIAAAAGVAFLAGAAIGFVATRAIIAD